MDYRTEPEIAEQFSGAASSVQRQIRAFVVANSSLPYVVARPEYRFWLTQVWNFQTGRRLLAAAVGTGEGLDAQSMKRAVRADLDLTRLDLRDPRDLMQAHQILVKSNLAEPGPEGLFRCLLAAAMTTRLATTNPLAYFQTVVEKGFGQYGPSAADERWADECFAELQSGSPA